MLNFVERLTSSFILLSVFAALSFGFVWVAVLEDTDLEHRRRHMVDQEKINRR